MRHLDRLAAPLLLCFCLGLAFSFARANESPPIPDEQIVVIELDRVSGDVSARRAAPGELETLGASPVSAQRVRQAVRIDTETGQIDPLDAGLPWYWLAFGFGAQLLFTARMLVQWIASERAKASVVPTAFWMLSAAGGLMLLTYFLRRGDPVGVTGQAFGLVIYARNLFFIRRDAARDQKLAPENPATSAAEG